MSANLSEELRSDVLGESVKYWATTAFYGGCLLVAGAIAGAEKLMDHLQTETVLTDQGEI